MSGYWAMRKSSRAGFGPLLALLCLLFAALPALAAPRIGVMTMQPGDIFWERFGHDAIIVDDPALSEPISYNFGFFDLEEPGFVSRFVRGEMEYALVALPLSQDLELYRQEGRGVSVIIDMVHHTRLGTIAGTIGIMRMALAQAVHHVSGRRAFQKTLIDQPLMEAVIADLAVEYEAAVALTLTAETEPTGEPAGS